MFPSPSLPQFMVGKNNSMCCLAGPALTALTPDYVEPCSLLQTCYLTLIAYPLLLLLFYLTCSRCVSNKVLCSLNHFMGCTAIWSLG